MRLRQCQTAVWNGQTWTLIVSVAHLWPFMTKSNWVIFFGCFIISSSLLFISVKLHRICHLEARLGPKLVPGLVLSRQLHIAPTGLCKGDDQHLHCVSSWEGRGRYVLPVGIERRQGNANTFHVPLVEQSFQRPVGTGGKINAYWSITMLSCFGRVFI